MSVDLPNPIFSNEDAARKHFEALRWPNGRICPHCGVVDNSVELKGESTRAGLYKCRACDLQFSAMIGTVMESSHVPMTKWALAFHLMASSKKGVSAHQLMRMLGLGSYRTAWFMAHRVREAMADLDPEPLGGKGKTVEIDETFIGKPDDTFVKRQGLAGKARNGNEAQGSHNGREGRALRIGQGRRFDAGYAQGSHWPHGRLRQHAQYRRSAAL